MIVLEFQCYLDCCLAVKLFLREKLIAETYLIRNLPL